MCVMFWRSEMNTLDPHMGVRSDVIGLGARSVCQGVRSQTSLPDNTHKSQISQTCSDGRRHLKWCHHLSLCLPKPWSMSPTLIKVVILVV